MLFNFKPGRFQGRTDSLPWTTSKGNFALPWSSRGEGPHGGCGHELAAQTNGASYRSTEISASISQPRAVEPESHEVNNKT